MARGIALGMLVDMVRSEARHSNNPALGQNVRPSLVQALQRTQETLYEDYDWPFLRVRQDKLTQAGERYYDLPSMINLDRVEKVETKWATEWRPVSHGIETSDYTTWDSDSDIRVDPVQKWDTFDTGTTVQLEFWPIPVTNGNIVRFTGIRKLKPLVADTDVCDLDGQMLVLYVAAELLAHQKQADAQAKLAAARALLSNFKARLRKKRQGAGRITLNGPSDREPRQERERIRVAYVR